MNEAIILAGGFGTRLSSVVRDVPKPMASIGGKPFLCYLLARLMQGGYEHVVLATGYMHEKVEQYFGSEYGGLSLSYAVEEIPLGTGGAIVNALQYCKEDTVTVLNGDTLFAIDYSHLRRYAAQTSTRAVLVLRRVDDAGRYGAVEIDSKGRITAFREKDLDYGSGFINGGIYQLSRSLLAGHAVNEAFSFEHEVLMALHQQQPFFAYVADDYFIDIGIPADYYRAQTELPQL